MSCKDRNLWQFHSPIILLKTSFWMDTMSTASILPFENLDQNNFLLETIKYFGKKDKEQSDL